MLPENKNVLKLLDQIASEELLLSLIRQINKDAQLVGLDFDLDEKSTALELITHIKLLLVDLINNNFSDYVNFLYRIDVPEKEMLALQGLEINILAEKVTLLILRKEWQKVWFKNKNR